MDEYMPSRSSACPRGFRDNISCCLPALRSYHDVTLIPQGLAQYLCCDGCNYLFTQVPGIPLLYRLPRDKSGRQPRSLTAPWGILRDSNLAENTLRYALPKDSNPGAP